jgi:hypothetical protein
MLTLVGFVFTALHLAGRRHPRASAGVPHRP